METLKEIKKRVTSVKNTQKITNAMKLVSSAKFNKANKAVVGARPYRAALDDLLAQLLQTDSEHPLLEEKPEHKILVLLFTSDRGLCGALNAHLLKFTHAKLVERYGTDYPSSVDFMTLGKKAEQFCSKHSLTVVLHQKQIEHFDRLTWQRQLLSELLQYFLSARYDAVYLSYQFFVSGLQQVPSWQRLLPIAIDTDKTNAPTAAGDILLEPNRQQVLEQVLRQNIANQLYSALLNSIASEHCSRMNAMDNATNNAKKVVKELTLKYNRGRQAAITKELIEITAGVQAI